MKTNNFNLDLMVPNQANKEITYNESIFKIDAFLNLSVISFIEQKPNTLGPVEKYVIATGNDKNKICYNNGQTKAIELFKPYEGMILYFIKEAMFYIYTQENWQPIVQSSNSYSQSSQQPSNSKEISFIGISKKFIPVNDQELYYLYMNDECEIDLSNLHTVQLTIIIKQNYQKTHELKWSPNILWPLKKPHILTATPNSMDIIKLYKLPETNNFLATITNHNYQF